MKTEQGNNVITDVANPLTSDGWFIQVPLALKKQIIGTKIAEKMIKKC